jgi:hypothetical protein
MRGYPPHQIPPPNIMAYPSGRAPHAYRGIDANARPEVLPENEMVAGMILPLPYMFVSPNGLEVTTSG